MKKWLFILPVLAVTGYVVFSNFSDKPAFWSAGAVAGARKPAAPTTAIVALRDINFAITAAGDVGPVDTVSVRPEVGGIISKLTLDIGDKVKKDDVLFELNDKDLQTEKSTRQIEIAGAKLAIETQKLELEKAFLNFDRVNNLFAKKFSSQAAFDEARIAHELAKNSMSISSNRHETALSALQQVEDKLTKTIIRAPFDCTILTRPVSVGQAVSGASGFNSGTEVFSIANLTDLIITAHINQTDVTRLKVDQAVDVAVEAVAGLKMVGYVNRIAPQATFKNGIKGYATRIILKNAETSVRPGMTANLSIPLATAGNVAAIPLAAVFNDQADRYVYVKTGDTFERRIVELGVADYEFVAINKGLDAGEEVSLLAPKGEGAPPPPVMTPMASK